MSTDNNSQLEIDLKIKYLDHYRDLPKIKYATQDSAGIDLLSAMESNVILPSGKFRLIKTGIALALPKGYEAQIRPRSGLALNHGISVLNTPGTIDADYRGEIGVILVNFSGEDFRVERGMRIAQLVINQYTRANLVSIEEFDEITERGQGGFGSTGV